ncbi:MAG: TraB/GumN family protein [Bacteroidota bacterium]|nr:TraB/GumN family protein [Bacteroidota bacterium]
MILLGPFQMPAQDLKLSGKSLLWEISGNGLLAPSYLYGTIHLICEANLQVPETVQQALIKSEQLALELDMADPDFLKEFQKAMLMQEGTNLRKLLSKDDYQLVTNFFKDSLDINLKEVGVIKPLYMNSMMYSKILGCQPQPYEMALVSIALRDAKPVKGLETIQQQLDLFGIIPYNKQAQMLVESIRNFNETKMMYQELLNLYKQQDIEGAYKLVSKNTTGLEDFEEALLKGRNKNWIPVMEAFSKEKSTFYAVGAGHLGGETGLIKLLRQKGYTLKPILYIENFEKVH